jgi:peptidoglycan-associated lipoprotein
MKKLTIILILSIAAFSSLLAQPFGATKPEIMLKVAEECMVNKDYYNALEWYDKYYESEKDKSVAIKIAELNYLLRDYAKAESWYARAIGNKKDSIADEAVRFKYARALKMNEKYDEAISVFQEYLASTTDAKMKTLTQNELEGCKMARKMVAPENIIVANIGNKVNTTNGEYSPSWLSENEIIFTSHRSKEVIIMDGSKGGDQYRAKIYTSKKGAKGAWADPKVLDDEINRPGYEQGNVALHPRGNLMYFTRAELEGTVLKSSSIYYSVKDEKEQWGPANEVKGINGTYIAKQPAIGELFGKEVMFFVSNMEGGKGGFDIYYATKLSDGTFSTPNNLGPTINTVGDEETPFYKDGKLYFSSNGLPTIGGFDIFVSTWNGAEWSAPSNLGKGFNSNVDDLYFSLDEDGYNGLIVSNRVGTKSLKSKTCCDDIFSFSIEKIKADLTALTLEKNKSLSGATVQLMEMDNGRIVKADSKTNAGGNSFNYLLDIDKAYMIVGSKSGYTSDTVSFNTVGLLKKTKIEKKLNLKSVPKVVVKTPNKDSVVVSINEPIRLNNIYYNYDDDKILPDAEPDLNYLDSLMKRYPDMVIELSSHTDARGNDAYNQRLSQRRAESAKQYLIKRGITEPRIRPVGYGESIILNRCTNGIKCNDDEHRFNRRTEFKIVAGPTSITIKKQQSK